MTIRCVARVSTTYSVDRPVERLGLDLVGGDHDDPVELQALGLQAGEHREPGQAAAGGRLGEVGPAVEPLLHLRPPGLRYDDPDRALDGAGQLGHGVADALAEVDDRALLGRDPVSRTAFGRSASRPDPVGVRGREVVDLLAVAVVRRQVEVVPGLVAERRLAGRSSPPRAPATTTAPGRRPPSRSRCGHAGRPSATASG